jgi:tetratricopeptide (TPR) repeat protein
MSESEVEFHRKIARKCFNETWNYLDKKDRSADDEWLMLHLAHASRYHWSLVGSPENLAVGDWQISRVYAVLNEPELALHFAKSCLEICQKHNLTDALHTGYEAMARAYAVAGNYQLAKDHLSKAKEQLLRLKLDVEDRKIYLDQIRETEQLIKA